MNFKYLDSINEYSHWVTRRFIGKLKPEHFRIMSIEQTITKILQDGVSIVRFGDGEMKLVNGISLGFQCFDSQLSLRLKAALRSNEHNLLVCIPDIFNDLSSLKENAKKYWIHHLYTYYSHWYNLTNSDRIYGNAFLSRLYFDNKDVNQTEQRFQMIRSIWHDRDILIVEGAETRLGINNNLLSNSKSIIRILCPPTNAFTKYFDILEEVKKQSTKRLVLVSLGPTAKVLVGDLNKIGYQVIDIGHLDVEYEWFLKKADKKTPIQYKYVNEIKQQGEVSVCNDIGYVSQIVKKII